MQLPAQSRKSWRKGGLNEYLGPQNHSPRCRVSFHANVNDMAREIFRRIRSQLLAPKLWPRDQAELEPETQEKDEVLGV